MGHGAHCARVAAYCDEITRQTGLSESIRAGLRGAARLHHDPERLSFFADRMAVEVGLEPRKHALPREASITKSILATYLDSVAASDANLTDLVHILEMADIFDEGLEFGAFGDRRLTDTLKLASETQDDPESTFVLSYLLGPASEDLDSLANQLPVLPKVALDLMRIVRSRDVTVERLVELTDSDQVLAKNVMCAANSALHNRGYKIGNVAQGVAHLGIDITRGILLANAVKPILAIPGLRDLWQHSVEAAQAAERLALRTGRIDPGEAYTIGLLHDVGRLLLRLVHPDIRARRERLESDGCSSAVAELITSGLSHAEAGAKVLRAWNLPQEYITAIEYHHEPEHCDSDLAALLYIVEGVTASEEDLPSQVRWQIALDRLRLSTTDLRRIQVYASDMAYLV